MLEIELLSRVRNFAQENSEKDDIHGFAHTERVYDLCIQIGEKLGANLFILKVSALLHDIGRKRESKTNLEKNHAEFSAEIAKKFLKLEDFEISEEIINEIIHCIRSHSFSHNSVPETLEAKILSDADKLDALGAIGLYRTIGFTIKNEGGIDQVIKHLEEKILILNNRLNLDFTKKLALDKQKIIQDFYNEIKSQG
ncbi:MAG: HD domain-containing protein [Promethearchaeota archaeon]|jgi:uncharacterized protein